MKKRLSILLILLLSVALSTPVLAEDGLDMPTDAIAPEVLENVSVPDGLPEAGIDLDLTGAGLDLDLAGTELESGEPRADAGFTVANENVAGDIPIDAEHFPDGNFRSLVSSRFDGDFDGMLSENERNMVFEIDAVMQGIENLAGIEWFPNLNRLYCNSNGMNAPLDVSGNARLQRLDCSNNMLPSLRIGDCPALTALYCEDNDLTAVDVSGCPSLGILQCEHNDISSLDLTRCEALHSFAKEAPVFLDDGTACFGAIETDSGNSYRISIDPDTTIIIDGKVVYGKLQESLAGAEVSAKPQVYSGKAKKPAVTVTLNGKTLENGTDYTASYSNNRDIGKAEITVTGMGNYTGTAKGSFVIQPKAVAGLALKAGSKQITVSWKKGANNVGYELQYGLKKSFSGAKKVTISKNTTLKRVLKGLQTGKTCYVRIRAYKKVSGKTYYSAWSGTKSAKVK